MNNNPEKEIARLASLRPNKAAMDSLRERVLKDMDTKPVRSPWNPIFAGIASLGLVLVLFIANQMPMHNSYDRSISAIARASGSFEVLEKNQDAASAETVLEATKAARAELADLKLKGVFGAYTSEQCFHAYTIYDGYLDYVSDFLENTHPSDEPAQMAYAKLASYVNESREEAQTRLSLYPEGMQ